MKKFFKREKVFSEKGLVLKKNESFKAATFREMLRYATYFDYFLLFGGILGSITAGILQPNGAFIMIQIDGLMMDTHQDIIKGREDLDLVVTKTHEICKKLAINAFCIFTSSYFSVVLF
uniref:Uncharacterized protein n=1 Tax=Panagrolaimus sp. PS1159 TaxID=55785 RepID=A0AC35FRC2_9BILA